MLLYVCQNPKCKEKDRVKEIKGAWENWCACGEEMKKYVPAKRFSDAEVLMKKRMKSFKKPEGYFNYQIKVVEHLLKCDSFFQDDFINEVNRPIELDKFLGVGESSRSTDADKVCVDNALSSSKTPNKSGHPAGEKFTFEIPYIMEQCGWEYKNQYRSFQDDFSAFENIIEKESQYLVVVKRPSNEIGHMVMIVTDKEKNAYLIDYQKQPESTYSGVKYVAWKSHLPAPGSTPKPYCSIDLSNCKLGKWQ